MIDSKTEALLRYDPLAEAEKATGDRWGGYLGLALAFDHGAKKDAHLRAINDTRSSMSLDEYVAVIEEMGFEKVLELPFDVDLDYASHKRDAFFIYAHRDGLLLKFDTYFDCKKVNSGNVYYVWVANDWDDLYKHRCTSSGGVHDLNDPRWENRAEEKDRSGWVYPGNHDCREALRHNIDKLRQHGRFLAKWPKRPWLWLLHYMDTKGTYDNKAIARERIAMLPEWVQEMIGNEE